MVVRFASPAFLAIVMGWSAQAASVCPAEAARYIQRDGNRTTAALVPAGSFGTAASDLYLRIATTRHRYWFRIQSANGYGGLSLEAIHDPTTGAPAERGRPLAAPDIAEQATPSRLIPLRRDLSEITDAPRTGTAAPEILLLPDLGPALWYDSAALGGNGERERVSRSAFVLASCRRR